MRYSQGNIGRIFALRLESGDRLPDSVVDFARKQNIKSALVTYVGGADATSRFVVGPQENSGEDIIPIVHTLGGINEVVAMGTLFPDEQGNPELHMHAAAGREGKATVGCVRAGVDVWLIGEVIVLEILGIEGLRKIDPQTGFQLLELSKTL